MSFSSWINNTLCITQKVDLTTKIDKVNNNKCKEEKSKRE